MDPEQTPCFFVASDMGLHWLAHIQQFSDNLTGDKFDLFKIWGKNGKELRVRTLKVNTMKLFKYHIIRTSQKKQKKKKKKKKKKQKTEEFLLHENVKVSHKQRYKQ